MTTVTKRRRRDRCEFCDELFHHEGTGYWRGVCPTCYPAMLEVWQLDEGKELAGPWREYQAVIPALARGEADLVLRDRTATRFHAGWRLLDEQGRQVVGAEIKRLSRQREAASRK